MDQAAPQFTRDKSSPFKFAQQTQLPPLARGGSGGYKRRSTIISGWRSTTCLVRSLANVFRPFLPPLPPLAKGGSFGRFATLMLLSLIALVSIANPLNADDKDKKDRPVIKVMIPFGVQREATVPLLIRGVKLG